MKNKKVKKHLSKTQPKGFRVGDLVRTNTSLGLVGQITEIKDGKYYLNIGRFEGIYSTWYSINQFTKWEMPASHG